MNYNFDKRKLEAFVIFARMYGIKETLEPLPFVTNEDFFILIMKWTEEYIDTNEKDILQFFESRFHDNAYAELFCK